MSISKIQPNVFSSTTAANNKVALKISKAAAANTLLGCSTISEPKSTQKSSFSSQSVLPKKSGDSNIDALIYGGTNAWQHTLGAEATKSSDVIHDNVFSLNNVVQNNGNIYYSFMTRSIQSSLTGSDKNGFEPMDGRTQSAVKTAFDYLSSLINVKFVETNDTKKSTILLGKNDQGNVSAGYAYLPNQSGNHAQYLFLNSKSSTNNTASNPNAFAPGTYSWQTLVHEIGHTMGLKHPFNGNAGGGGTPPPYLPTKTNNHRYSVMSYTPATDAIKVDINVGKNSVSRSASRLNPSTYMTYDIEALQYLYGANKSVSGNTAALNKVQKLTFSINYSGFQTLWTPWGGSLDASAVAGKNIVDLRAGAYSSINYETVSDRTATITKKMTSIGFSASAAKSFISSSGLSQSYSGLNNVGLAYGSELASVKTGKGDDDIYTSNYSSVIDGGDGVNTVYLQGKQSDWTLSTTSEASIYTSKNSNSKLTLKNIDAIKFYSATSALIHA